MGTAILWPFVRDDPCEPVPEETFTHLHLSWSSTILYQLPLSTTIHSILPVQFTCLTVFLHNLSPGPLWSTSLSGTLHFILHTFLQLIIVFFHNTCPYCFSLFCCSERLSSIPSLSSLHGLSFTILISARWSAHFLSLQAMSYFYATYYFLHCCCIVSLS